MIHVQVGLRKHVPKREIVNAPFIDHALWERMHCRLIVPAEFAGITPDTSGLFN